MERHVLVTFPHPDDETLAVGGAIAAHAQSGSPVTYACFTLGQMGRNMGKPFFANRETLPSIRERELRDACKHLGITDLRLMGMRDKMLEFEDPERLIGAVHGLLTELRPSLVITYYPGYCVHPDHEAIAAATVEAIRRLPEADRPKLHCQAFARGYEEALGRADVVMDTSGVRDRVYAAIKAHRSQTAAWIGQLEAAAAAGGEALGQIDERFRTSRLYTYSV